MIKKQVVSSTDVADKKSTTVHVVLGSHLFPVPLLDKVVSKQQSLFMCESQDLAQHFRYHKLKIYFFFTSMRCYADTLQQHFDVHYYDYLDNQTAKLSFFERLLQHCLANNITKISCFYPEDRFFKSQLDKFCDKHSLDLSLFPSPLFFNQPYEFEQYLENGKKPFLKTYYQQQRLQHSILLEQDQSPTGGQWSFDEFNRKKIPKNTQIPSAPPSFQVSTHHADVLALISQYFDDHPGQLDSIWFAVTYEQAQQHLDFFLHEKFTQFGDYQDAIEPNQPFLYHSLLSVYINSGLLPVQEVLSTALQFAQHHQIPLNALEGFIRQLIGWREFVRGIDHIFGEQQAAHNFFNHQRQLTSSWYTGTTGIAPLDDTIQKALQYGYGHHIERLMIVGNLMLLCEIQPMAAFTWFMEMYIDSADWVMGPNVYGMALFSDGGIFATKPYICGSNYIFKMGHFPKGPWQDIMDGLYWRFIDKNKDFFRAQYRLSMMVRQLDKLKPERKNRIFNAAEQFLDQHTR